ncbi:hypothetical protein AVEN_88096-1 [Araneus ventricosus]|uniref:Uncharacterized protein n=1 Tax=Araneus ventricosus TaxID=182803 RepID=A0A4Y2H1I9_ARAVE|nr:hypothetical protein AVEN_88096-1 [Araneus ventricosus]
MIRVRKISHELDAIYIYYINGDYWRRYDTFTCLTLHINIRVKDCICYISGDYWRRKSYYVPSAFTILRLPVLITHLLKSMVTTGDVTVCVLPSTPMISRVQVTFTTSMVTTGGDKVTMPHERLFFIPTPLVSNTNLPLLHHW